VSLLTDVYFYIKLPGAVKGWNDLFSSKKKKEKKNGS